MPTKKNDDSTENEVLNFLVSNFDKLKILLSPSLSKKPFKYRFKGKKGTKTVFMSIKLQYLINEYCIENDTKIGDITETAIVEFLLRHDYTDKLNTILLTPLSEGDEGDSPQSKV